MPMRPPAWPTEGDPCRVAGRTGIKTKSAIQVARKYGELRLYFCANATILKTAPKGRPSSSTPLTIARLTRDTFIPGRRGS